MNERNFPKSLEGIRAMAQSGNWPEGAAEYAVGFLLAEIESRMKRAVTQAAVDRLRPWARWRGSATDEQEQQRRADVDLVLDERNALRVEIYNLRAAQQPQLDDLATDFGEAMEALESLSFECDGVTCVRAPSRETYNRAFEVLDRLRRQRNGGKAYGGPSGTAQISGEQPCTCAYVGPGGGGDGRYSERPDCPAHGSASKRQRDNLADAERIDAAAQELQRACDERDAVARVEFSEREERS